MLAITQQCDNFVVHCCIPNAVSNCASIVLFNASPQYVTFPHSFFNLTVSDPGNSSEVLGVDRNMWN